MQSSAISCHRRQTDASVFSCVTNDERSAPDEEAVVMVFRKIISVIILGKTDA